MPTDVAGLRMPNASIGFVGADIYDANRTTLGALAFEANGQTKAYYVDSTPSARDRQNVRDGHYTPWGYEHMFAYVDGTGTPTNANAGKLINIINGVIYRPGGRRLRRRRGDGRDDSGLRDGGQEDRRQRPAT